MMQSAQLTQSGVGIVYFIKCDAGDGINRVKIGQTRDLKKRISSLQTGNPHKLTIYQSITTPGYKKLELELHAKFKDKKINNEWFSISDSEIDDIVSGFTKDDIHSGQ